MVKRVRLHGHDDDDDDDDVQLSVLRRIREWQCNTTKFQVPQDKPKREIKDERRCYKWL